MVDYKQKMAPFVPDSDYPLFVTYIPTTETVSIHFKVRKDVDD